MGNLVWNLLSEPRFNLLRLVLAVSGRAVLHCGVVAHTSPAGLNGFLIDSSFLGAQLGLSHVEIEELMSFHPKLIF